MGQWDGLTKKLPECEDVKMTETVTGKSKAISNGDSFKTTAPFSSYFQRFCLSYHSLPASIRMPLLGSYVHLTPFY
jgi:hypothetical protein